MKHSFKNDYSELAHPQIMNALAAIGDRQFEGYSLDEYSFRASELIRAKIENTSADIHFISGGTLSNLLVISSALRPHEAVIACKSGHIFVHETGAIESTGHKVCTAEGENGKLRPRDVEAILDEHTDEHMVKPRLVYISQSTEVGTVYTKAELRELSDCCHKRGLYLFIDGARLGTALNSHACDLTYKDVAELADAFYIGGTKNGALFGEAVVIKTDELKPDFRFIIKQRGALLSKGAAIGLQFEALFKDGLYDELAGQSNKKAMILADGIRAAGYGFQYEPVANQIFPIFPDEIVEKLHKIYGFYDWQKVENKTSVRLVTSWATPENAVEEFLIDLREL